MKKLLAAQGIQPVSHSRVEISCPDDWSKMDKNEYLNAMSLSVSDDTETLRLLKDTLTDEIDSREMFMKGIDYSYYYEQEDGQ